jgi:colicin import membrane protein
MTSRTLGKSTRGNDINFHKMIFLSLIIHLIVITVMLVSIRTSSRHLTFGPVYSVQLVGSEAIRAFNDSALLKDIQASSRQAPDSIIIKRKINSIYSPLLKSDESHKINIDKAVSAIRHKEQGRLKTDENVTPAGRSNLPDTETNKQANEYIGAVWIRIKQNWSMPPSLLPEKNISTIIDVKISRSGALEYANFEKRSGNRYFDDSALRAIRKSGPFPPLPSWIRDNSIEIGVRFNSAELR